MGMDSDYAHAFADAVAREINAERGRQNIGSYRAFARLIGDPDHTSITKRLNLEPKSGAQPVPMSMIDLATYCAALRVEPAEIIRRAEETMSRATVAGMEDDLATRTAAYRRGAAAATPPPSPPPVARDSSAR